MAGITLDDLDLRILAILQDDASVSNLQLAERALSSPPTCMRRVRRLTEAGVIRRQVAVLDPVAIGTAVTALIEISLDRQTAEDYDAFEAYVRGAGRHAVLSRVAGAGFRGGGRSGRRRRIRRIRAAAVHAHRTSATCGRSSRRIARSSKRTLGSRTRCASA